MYVCTRNDILKVTYVRTYHSCTIICKYCTYQRTYVHMLVCSVCVSMLVSVLQYVLLLDNDAALVQNTLMSELKTRVEELRMENEYQLRLKDMNHNEKVKEMSDKFQQEMEALKAKYSVSSHTYVTTCIHT